jgi:hypothetical protein
MRELRDMPERAWSSGHVQSRFFFVAGFFFFFGGSGSGSGSGS